MISYYDLLGLVQEGNAPERIRVEVVRGTSRVYIIEYDVGEFNYYRLEDDLEDENYHHYLSECFLESSMFDKCIEILDEEKEFEDIEEIILIENSPRDLDRLADKINHLIKNQKKIIKEIKELKK